MNDERHYLSTREAAEYLGLSARTLDRYRVSGEGPVFHRLRGPGALHPRRSGRLGEGDRTVPLSWSAAADCGSQVAKRRYRHLTGPGAFGDWTDIPLSGASRANAAGWTVRGLRNGTLYTFEVRAVSAGTPPRTGGW